MEEVKMDFTHREVMAAAAAMELADGEVVVSGLGLPQVSTQLAKMTHAPRITEVIEIGVVNAKQIHQSVGIADPSSWLGASYYGSFIEVLGLILHRGLVDVGFLTGLEVDQFGNLNTTLIKTSKGERHINGSGGANDIASLARKTIIIMRHEKQKLSERVMFSTTPGFIEGGDSRKKIGLRGGGPSRVITDKAVMGFDESTKRMKLISVHPDVSLDDVVANTGFQLIIPDKVKTTSPPTKEQLRFIREVIDPGRLYTG
jgi:acyl CoA:acetate/3-ketoacid CoA transferase beta subunit